ncbi:MAG: type III secretion system export apparatus subunit SctT [Desulfovibrionaceae bacterium]|nr:type III secretion system export apparatus subunit SctT [Desulfovibrionaceae bacterium]
MIDFLEQLGLFAHLSAFLLAMPRIFSAALVAPFLGTGVLEGTVWFTLAFALYLPIHPAVLHSLTAETTIAFPLSLTFGLTYFAIFVKECCIGLFIGIIAGLPFWAVQGAGAFMDNQRGASQAEESDFLTGKSSTPMGIFLFELLVYLFFSSGAFLLFMSLIYSSYEFWPVTLFHPSLFTNLNIPYFFNKELADFMTDIILYAAPITVACLLVDIALGLINRFAQQLNAYVLAMPIKSGVAAVLLFFYLNLMIDKAPSIFHEIEENFLIFKTILGL